MTPGEYLQQLRFLVHSAQDAAAMAFAERWFPGVYPQMTAQEYERATSMLELPANMLDVQAQRAAAGLPEKTPAEYLQYLRMLVRVRRYAEARAFAERWSPGVFPLMTVEEREQATSMLETPSVIVDDGPRSAALDRLLDRLTAPGAIAPESRRRDP